MGGRPGARETAGPTCLLARAMQGGRCEMATFIISKKAETGLADDAGQSKGPGMRASQIEIERPHRIKPRWVAVDLRRSCTTFARNTQSQRV